MQVTVEVLSRPNVDQPFTTLVAAAVLTAAGSSIGFTPALPAGSDGLKLRLRVQSPDALSIDVGTNLDPANPPVPPVVPTKRGTFAAWAGQSRDISFGSHEAFLI